MSRERIKVTKIFKRNGVALTKDALMSVVQALQTEGSWEEKEAKAEDIVEKLKDIGQLSGGKASIQAIQAALEAMERGGEEEAFVVEAPLRILDAFETPHQRYFTVQKQFKRVALGGLQGTATEKASVFRDRFSILLQRALRHEDLRHASEGSAGVRANEDAYVITTTANLLGETGKKCVFGILTEIEEGKVHLEDLDGAVEVDITDGALNADTGFFTYNCFVLAEGEMSEGVFRVSVLAFPPYEPRSKALDVHPNLDFLKATDKKDKIYNVEKNQADEMFVFLSNVYLDQPRVLSSLEKLFEGFNEDPPGLFIIMGNFTKERLGTDPSDIPRLKRYFDALCDTICKYRGIADNSRFVFVPGPRDPSVGNVLPRRGLLPLLTGKLRQRLRCSFPSNPCRIQWYTQEIVIFREDLQQKLRRNTVLPCELREAEEMSNHLVKTILDQAHLVPLPLICQPVYWAFDHALRLYPPPTCVVLGDQHEFYNYKYEQDSRVVNPGDFSSDFSFVVYRPAERVFDYSLIPDA